MVLLVLRWLCFNVRACMWIYVCVCLCVCVFVIFFFLHCAMQHAIFLQNDGMNLELTSHAATVSVSMPSTGQFPTSQPLSNVSTEVYSQSVAPGQQTHLYSAQAGTQNALGQGSIPSQTIAGQPLHGFAPPTDTAPSATTPSAATTVPKEQAPIAGHMEEVWMNGQRQWIQAPPGHTLVYVTPATGRQQGIPRLMAVPLASSDAPPPGVSSATSSMSAPAPTEDPMSTPLPTEIQEDDIAVR